MEKELISIVVPVYNVEKYIEKCVLSILNQTYEKFELLIVDDGSKDSSGEICDKLAENDVRIKVIHQENKGLSGARNTAIDIAKGKYITFIDSDDYIEKDYLEYLYMLCKKYNTKISICAQSVVTNKGKKIEYTDKKSEKKMDKVECIKNMLLEDGYSVSACAKLYSLDLFEDIRYPIGRLCEDNGTTYKLIDKVEYISYGSESKYLYLKRNDSIMGGQFNIKKYDLITLTDEMCEYLKSKNYNIDEVLEKRKMYARFSVLRQIVFATNRNIEVEDKIIKELLENEKNIMNNKYSSIRDKLALIVLKLFGKKGFILAWRIYSSVKY